MAIKITKEDSIQTQNKEVVPETNIQQYDKEWKNTFIKNLTFLNKQTSSEADQPLKIFRQFFLNKLVEQLSEMRSKYYQADGVEHRKNLYKVLTSKTAKGHLEYLQTIAENFVLSPLGLFKDVFDEEIPDFFITGRKIILVNGSKRDELVIPEELLKIYKIVFLNFISMTLVSSTRNNTKFDRTNAVLDYTTEGLRFNAVNEALSANTNEPIVAVRKQILSKLTSLNDDYVKSLGLSEKQEKVINDFANTNQTVMISGQTGSGKTVFLKYIVTKGAKNYTNIISIEDTPELYLPCCDIAYLTNDKFSIADMFKLSLRENPDMLVIGETRDAVILDALESSLVFPVLTTIHADSFQATISRIIFMIKSKKPEYTTEDLILLIKTALDGFVVMENRKVKEVYVRNPKATLDDPIDDYYTKIE